MELARNRNDLDEQTRIVTRMESDFPQSQWLAEAVFSSGNMYLLLKDYSRAADTIAYLADHFPSNKNASAAHWRAGWLNYRLGNFNNAERIFDEQIHNFPGTPETAPPSTGVVGSTSRKITTLRRPPPITERLSAYTSTSSMRRWRVNDLPLSALPRPPLPDLDQIKTPELPMLADSFPETVHILPRQNCSPTQA